MTDIDNLDLAGTRAASPMPRRWVRVVGLSTLGVLTVLSTHFVICVALIAGVVAIYFAPVLVARHYQHKKSTAIFVLNLFGGWTLVGWVAALVWAFAV